MKKIFTLLAIASAVASSYAQVPNDTLTVESIGIDLSKGSYDVYNSTQKSGAEFYAYSLRNYNTVEVEKVSVVNDTVALRIQLRGANRTPFSGIVATKSDKNVAKVIVKWGANTNAARTLDVYGSTIPYETADSLNAKISENRGVKVGSTDFVPATETEPAVTHGEVDVEGDYPYVGLRLAGTTAAYFDTIFVGYKAGEGLVYDTLTVKSLGINRASGSYAAYTSETQEGAVAYYAYAMSNAVIEKKEVVTTVKDTIGVDLQLRGNNKTPFSGIVMTKSNGHDVKKVILNWSSANTNSSRTLDVYGSTVPYVSADSLNAKIEANRTTNLGGMTYVPKTEEAEAVDHTELEIPAGYPYIGLRMVSSAAYFSNIVIVYYEEATAIEELAATKNDDRIYDLSGKQMKNAVKSGLYIKNGKVLMSK